MLRLPNRTRTAGTMLAAIAGALGGCAAEADLAYGEYRYGPGYQTERLYERRVYGSTTEGLGSEACRLIHRRRVNEFGEVEVRRVRVCDETAEPVPPPADVPNDSGDVWQPG